MDSDDQKTAKMNLAAGGDPVARRETEETAAPSGSAGSRMREPSEPRTPKVARGPAIVVTLIVAAIVGLSLWYLVQPQPLIIQGEADATRIDIAARVDGRVLERPVERGDNVVAGQLLYKIDNPELVTKLKEAEAGLAVASAQLANTLVGTRVEVLAQRKAAVESASANLTLAQQTYDRVKELARSGNAPLQKLDEATDNLKVAQRSMDAANFANEEAINGATKEERGIARANVDKAQADIDTIKAQVDELIVKAPVAAQVYQIGAELGEYVSPGRSAPLPHRFERRVAALRHARRPRQGIEARGPVPDACPCPSRPVDHGRNQGDRDQRRICRMALDACDRRL